MDDRDKIIQYRFTAYLIRSIERYKIEYQRKKEQRLRIEELVEDIGKVTHGYAANTEFDDWPNSQNIKLEMVLDEIQPKDRQILLLHLIKGYSLKEIANMLSLNYNSVRSSFTRTLKRIKKEMDGEHNEF